MNISAYDIARGNCVPRQYINHEAPEFTEDELEQWAEGNLDLEGLPSFEEAQEEGTGNPEVDEFLAERQAAQRMYPAFYRSHRQPLASEPETEEAEAGDEKY